MPIFGYTQASDMPIFGYAQASELVQRLCDAQIAKGQSAGP